MSRHFYKCTLILLFCFQYAAGELPMAHLGSTLAGVIKGRPTVDSTDVARFGISHRDLPWVKTLGKKVSTPPYLALLNNDTYTCSGVNIEGCILTSQHCAKAGGKVFFGAQPDQSSQPDGEIGLTLGTGTDNPPFDVMVMAPKTPFKPSSKIKALPRTVLADFYPTSVPATIAGFGHNESRWDESKFDYVNQGVGRLRVGNVKTRGTQEGVVYADPDPESVAPGDSGSGLWHDGSLVGISHAIVNNESGVLEHSRRPSFTAIKHIRQRIINALIDLGCGDYTDEEIELRLQFWLSKLNPKTVAKDWAALSETQREIISGLIRRRTGMPPSAKVTLESFNGKARTVTLRVDDFLRSATGTYVLP